VPWWLMQRREGGAETQAETRVRRGSTGGDTMSAQCRRPGDFSGRSRLRDGERGARPTAGGPDPECGGDKLRAADTTHATPSGARVRRARGACCENRMVAGVVSNFFLNYQLISTFPLERRLCRVASPSARL
jgi:hypothetical protein